MSDSRLILVVVYSCVCLTFAVRLCRLRCLHDNWYWGHYKGSHTLFPNLTRLEMMHALISSFQQRSYFGYLIVIWEAVVFVLGQDADFSGKSRNGTLTITITASFRIFSSHTFTGQAIISVTDCVVNWSRPAYEIRPNKQAWIIIL